MDKVVLNVSRPDLKHKLVLRNALQQLILEAILVGANSKDVLSILDEMIATNRDSSPEPLDSDESVTV